MPKDEPWLPWTRTGLLRWKQHEAVAVRYRPSEQVQG